MTTWGEVHAGDVVRGADQRGWTVTGVQRGAAWLGSGRREVHLTLRLDDRTAEVRRGVAEPVDITTRADHRDTAAACAALIEHGLTATILEETLSDPFTTPAAPKTAAVRHDRFGRYVLPDPDTGKERSWTRATTVARTLADEYHLTRWKMRQVAKGMALRPDLVAGAAAADPEADKSTLDDIADKAMERAGGSAGSTVGTALHAFAQRINLGEPLASLGAPAPLDADLREYVDTLARHHLRVRGELTERVIVVPALGIAGKLDAIVEQPTGVTKSAPLAVMDLKTAKSIDYSLLEIAIQLAIYSRAAALWDPARGEYEPMPAVDQERALVLHLPVGKAHGQIYGLNIAQGWEYTQLAGQVRAARSGAKNLGWLVGPEPADLALHRVRRAADQAELARLWDLLHPKGLWTEEVNAAAATRFDELQTASA